MVASFSLLHCFPLARVKVENGYLFGDNSRNPIHPKEVLPFSEGARKEVPGRSTGYTSGSGEDGVATLRERGLLRNCHRPENAVNHV